MFDQRFLSYTDVVNGASKGFVDPSHVVEDPPM